MNQQDFGKTQKSRSDADFRKRLSDMLAKRRPLASPSISTQPVALDRLLKTIGISIGTVTRS